MSTSSSSTTSVAVPSVLQRIVDAPVTAQHVHPFVEGCTCGAGLVGCCPCAVGTMAQPTLQVHAPQGARRYGPPPPASATHFALPVGVAALSVAGVGFGVRAMWLNRQASARVAESLEGVRAQSLAIDSVLEAKRALNAAAAPVRSCCAPKAETPSAPSAFDTLGVYQERLRRLQRRLTDSQAERRFEAWVPGALQVVASAGGLVSLLPHATLGAWHSVVSSAVSGAWAVFAAAFAVHAANKAVQAGLQARALKRFSIAHDEADRKSVRSLRARTLSLSQRTAVTRTLETVAWLGFAAGAAALAVPASSFVGVSIAMNVGSWLGYGVLGTGLAATFLSAYLRRPTHTMTLPALRDMPMDASGVALAQLSERCLQKQRAALSDYVNEARNHYGREATSLRLRMAWQSAAYPSCGPKAYSAVADRAMLAPRDAPLGEQQLARAVVRVLSAERDLLQDWLKAEGPSDDSPVAFSRGETAAEEVANAALHLSATERRRPALMRRRHAVLGELIEQWAQRKKRLPEETTLASKEERKAERQRLAEQRQDLRIATLLAMGLAGESLSAHAKGDKPKATTVPHLSPLAHLHVEPVPETLQKTLVALRPKVEHLFVRVFCNPHRLEEASAVVEQELAALARQTQRPVATRPTRAPGCANC